MLIRYLKSKILVILFVITPYNIQGIEKLLYYFSDLLRAVASADEHYSAQNYKEALRVTFYEFIVCLHPTDGLT